MRRQLLTGLLMTIALTVLLGLIFPMAVWGVSQVAFNDKADGSFVKNKDGQVVGSSLIGQSFLDADGNAIPKYFQPRPSAAGAGYDALASGGSNLGPSNPKLIAPATGPDCYLVDKTDADGNPVLDASGNPEECYGDHPAGLGDVPAERGSTTPVPVDAVTASASGLDPHISVANAKLQAARVAKERNMSIDEVEQLIANHTEGRAWGFLGEKVVNVLELNLDLDRQG